MEDNAQENAGAHSPRPSRLGLLRFSAVEMLIALVLLFVTAPFVEGLRGGDTIEVILMTLFFLSTVPAVGGRGRTLLVTVILVVPALIFRWLNHLQPQAFSPVIYHVSGIVFLVFIIVHILRFVLRTPRVNSEVLCASVSVYLMFGFVWAMAYRLVAHVAPAAFAFNSTQVMNQPMEGFTAFYFSFVTLSTVGYGDITPVSGVARMLAVTESMTGTLYVAVLIARLVALYSAPAPPNQSDNSDQPRP